MIMFARDEDIEGHRVYIKIRIVGTAILASSLRVRANAVFPRKYIRDHSAEKRIIYETVKEIN